MRRRLRSTSELARMVEAGARLNLPGMTEAEVQVVARRVQEYQRRGRKAGAEAKRAARRAKRAEWAGRAFDPATWPQRETAIAGTAASTGAVTPASAAQTGFDTNGIRVSPSTKVVSP